MHPTEITFFQRFEQNIVNGSKTITIRDQAESGYLPGSVVDVFTYEERRWFARIRILSVTAINNWWQATPLRLGSPSRVGLALLP